MNLFSLIKKKRCKEGSPFCNPWWLVWGWNVIQADQIFFFQRILSQTPFILGPGASKWTLWLPYREQGRVLVTALSGMSQNLPFFGILSQP